MRYVDEPPLAANPNVGGVKFDYFRGAVSVFNNNAPGSNLPITIAAAKASYRFIGEKEYKDVVKPTGESNLEILDGLQFPLTIDPRQSANIKFEVAVPRTEEDAKRDVRWWNRALCARHQPIRVKLTLEDIEGEEASLVLEYVFKPFPFPQVKEEDLAAFWFDEPEMITRRMVKVEKTDRDDEVVRIDGTEVKVKTLERAVYRALKTGKTEVDLEIGKEKEYGEWEWKAWALVDISCRRVYAFKVLLQEGKLVAEDSRSLGCLGYALCPDYGQIIEGKTRPVSYATESVRFPPSEGLKPYVQHMYPQHDTVDDWKPPLPPKPSRTLSTSNLMSASPGGLPNGVPHSAIPLQVPEDLSRRLASLDTNLGRIADALEQLVGVLKPKP
jgi:hypothetical protein